MQSLKSYSCHSGIATKLQVLQHIMIQLQIWKVCDTDLCSPFTFFPTIHLLIPSGAWRTENVFSHSSIFFFSVQIHSIERLLISWLILNELSYQRWFNLVFFSDFLLAFPLLTVIGECITLFFKSKLVMRISTEVPPIFFTQQVAHGRFDTVKDVSYGSSLVCIFNYGIFQIAKEYMLPLWVLLYNFIICAFRQ